MKSDKWKIYAFWIAISEAVGLVAGLLIRSGVDLYSQTVTKPPLSPPEWVFPVVWTLLYALMGISAARIYLADDTRQRQQSINLFIAQLAVNFFWPLFFFNLQAFGFALIWLLLLWVLVLLLILNSRKVDTVAAWLLLPYLIWLTFAVYLNTGVVLLN